VAVEVTPLGFKKPDGNELFKKGDNVISDNAQKAQDLHANEQARLALLEQSAEFPGNPIALADNVVSLLVADPESETSTTLNETFAPVDAVQKIDSNGTHTPATFAVRLDANGDVDALVLNGVDL